MVFFMTLASAYQPGATALLALENLAAAGTNGNQLVSAERELLETIAKDARLSERARAYYRRMAQGLTQWGRPIEAFDHVVIDVADESLEVAGPTVPVGVFSDPNYCDRTQLLVENLTDYDVLIGLARLYISGKSHGFRLNFRAQNGGGSTTSQVLTHLMRNISGPVLCIVDSDRKFSGAGIGGTARGVVRAAKDIDEKWLLFVKVLSAREIENLVPSDLRRHCAETLAGDVAAQLDEFDLVDDLYSDYCCLKSGDSRCRMLGDALSKKQYSKIAELGALTPAARLVPACGTCPYPQGCFSSPALGQGYLQRVATALREGSGCTAVSGWKKELRDLIELVVGAGVVLTPQRV